MTIWQIKDQYGNVRLEYLDKNKAEEICLTINAMSGINVYTVCEKGG